MNNNNNVKLQLIDAIYFLYQNNKQIDEDFFPFIKKYFFDDLFINNITKSNIKNDVENRKIFTDLSIFLFENADHKYVRDVRKFEQKTIEHFRIGSTHIFKKHEKIQEFIDVLKQKYDVSKVKNIINYVLEIRECVYDFYNDYELISIPMIVNDQCEGIVFRTIGYKPIEKQIRNIYKFFITNPNTYILNKEVIEHYDTIFIVEGVFDVMSLYEIGVYNVISVSNVRFSRDVIDLLKNKNVILLFDDDMGGLTGLEYFYMNFHKQVKNVKYHQFDCYQYKDVDELRMNDKGRLKQIITNLQ